MAQLSLQTITGVHQLRDAIANGQIAEFKAMVFAVYVDGGVVSSSVGGSPARDVANRISYDVRPFDTNQQFDPTALNGIKPHNRPIHDGRIFSAAVGDLVHIVRFGPGTPNEGTYHVYQFTERPDYYLCSGDPLEASP